jgi:hypothetical protein
VKYIEYTALFPKLIVVNLWPPVLKLGGRHLTMKKEVRKWR